MTAKNIIEKKQQKFTYKKFTFYISLLNLGHNYVTCLKYDKKSTKKPKFNAKETITSRYVKYDKKGRLKNIISRL